MKPVVLLAMFLGAAGMNVSAGDWERWRDGRRVLLVRAASRDDTRWDAQIAALSEKRQGLAERDVAVLLWEGSTGLSLWPDGGELFPASVMALRFPGMQPANWRVALVGRDGEVKAVWDCVVAAAGIFARIDAMPMGRLEKEERRVKQP